MGVGNERRVSFDTMMSEDTVLSPIDFEAEMRELQDRNEYLEERNGQLESENEKLKDSLAVLKQGIASREKERDELSVKNHELQKLVLAANAEKEQMYKDLEDLKYSRALPKADKYLRDQLRQFEEQVRLLKADKDVASSQAATNKQVLNEVLEDFEGKLSTVRMTTAKLRKGLMRHVLGNLEYRVTSSRFRKWKGEVLGEGTSVLRKQLTIVSQQEGEALHRLQETQRLYEVEVEKMRWRSLRRVLYQLDDRVRKHLLASWKNITLSMRRKNMLDDKNTWQKEVSESSMDKTFANEIAHANQQILDDLLKELEDRKLIGHTGGIKKPPPPPFEGGGDSFPRQESQPEILVSVDDVQRQILAEKVDRKRAVAQLRAEKDREISKVTTQKNRLVLKLSNVESQIEKEVTRRSLAEQELDKIRAEYGELKTKLDAKIESEVEEVLDNSVKMTTVGHVTNELKRLKRENELITSESALVKRELGRRDEELRVCSTERDELKGRIDQTIALEEEVEQMKFAESELRKQLSQLQDELVKEKLEQKEAENQEKLKAQLEDEKTQRKMLLEELKIVRQEHERAKKFVSEFGLHIPDVEPGVLVDVRDALRQSKQALEDSYAEMKAQWMEATAKNEALTRRVHVLQDQLVSKGGESQFTRSIVDSLSEKETKISILESQLKQAQSAQQSLAPSAQGSPSPSNRSSIIDISLLETLASKDKEISLLEVKVQQLNQRLSHSASSRRGTGLPPPPPRGGEGLCPPSAAPSSPSSRASSLAKPDDSTVLEDEDAKRQRAVSFNAQAKAMTEMAKELAECQHRYRELEEKYDRSQASLFQTKLELQAQREKFQTEAASTPSRPAEEKEGGKVKMIVSRTMSTEEANVHKLNQAKEELKTLRESYQELESELLKVQGLLGDSYNEVKSLKEENETLRIEIPPRSRSNSVRSREDAAEVRMPEAEMNQLKIGLEDAQKDLQTAREGEAAVQERLEGAEQEMAELIQELKDIKEECEEHRVRSLELENEANLERKRADKAISEAQEASAIAAKATASESDRATELNALREKYSALEDELKMEVEGNRKPWDPVVIDFDDMDRAEGDLASDLGSCKSELSKAKHDLANLKQQLQQSSQREKTLASQVKDLSQTVENFTKSKEQGSPKSTGAPGVRNRGKSVRIRTPSMMKRTSLSPNALAPRGSISPSGPVELGEAGTARRRTTVFRSGSVGFGASCQQCRQIQEELDQVEEQLTEATSVNGRLEREVTTLRELISVEVDVGEDRIEALADHAMRSRELQSELYKVKKEKLSVEDSLHEIDRERTNLRHENDSLLRDTRLRLQQLEMMANEGQVKYDRQSESLSRAERRANSLEEELRLAKESQELHTKEHTILVSKLRHSEEALTSHIRDLQHQLRDEGERSRELSLQLQDAQLRLEKAEMMAQLQMGEQRSLANEEIAIFEGRIEDLSSKLRESDAEANRYKAELKASKLNEDNLTRHIENFRNIVGGGSRYSDTMFDVVAAEARNLTLRGEIVGYKTHISFLNGQRESLIQEKKRLLHRCDEEKKGLLEAVNRDQQSWAERLDRVIELCYELRSGKSEAMIRVGENLGRVCELDVIVQEKETLLVKWQAEVEALVQENRLLSENNASLARKVEDLEDQFEREIFDMTTSTEGCVEKAKAVMERAHGDLTLANKRVSELMKSTDKLTKELSSHTKSPAEEWELPEDDETDGSRGASKEVLSLRVSELEEVLERCRSDASSAEVAHRSEKGRLLKTINWLENRISEMKEGQKSNSKKLLKEKCKLLQLERDSMKGVNREMEKESVTLKGSLKRALAEVEALKSELRESNSGDIGVELPIERDGPEVMRLKQDIEDLRVRNKLAEEGNEEAWFEVSNLRTELEECRRVANRTIEDVKAAHDRATRELTTRCDELEKEVGHKEEMLRQEREQELRLEGDSSDLRKTIRELEDSGARSAENLASSNKKIEIMEAQKEQLEIEKSELLTELSKVQEELEKNKLALSETYKVIQIDKTRSRDVMTQAEARIVALQDENAKLQEGLQKSLEEESSLKSKLLDSETKLLKDQDLLDAMSKDLDGFQRKSATMEKENRSLKESAKKWTTEEFKLKDEVAQLQSQLKNAAVDMRNEREAMRSEHRDNVTKLNKLLEDEQARANDIERHLLDKTRELAEKDVLLEGREAEIDSVRSALVRLESAADQEKAKLQFSAYKSQTLATKEVREQTERHIQEREKWEQDMRELRQELELKAQRDISEVERGFQSSLEELRTQISALATDKTQMGEELVFLEQEIQRVENDKAEVEVEMMRVKSEMRHLEGRLEVCHAEKEKLSKTLREGLGSLTAELGHWAPPS